jgi:hypothetical protein
MIDMKALIVAGVFLGPATADASTVVFDNGPIDPGRTTWNVSEGFRILDDFVLTADTVITKIEYSVFSFQTPPATTTTLVISSDLTSSPIISVTMSPTSVANGLMSNNSVVPFGYTHTLDGLNISLSPGTYFLGIALADPLFTIASGPGSSSFGGSNGLFQSSFGVYANRLREGDHMAFTIYGDVNSVPVPAALPLFAAGLGALGLITFRRKCRQTA